MRKILHVGLHKTGTTSIQSGLKRNRNALAKVGVHYPSMSPLKEPDMAGHHPISRLLFEDADKNRAKLQSYVNDIEESADSDDTLIISTEGFCRYTANSLKGASHLERRKAYVSEMAKSFGTDCEIVLAFRRPDNYGISLYQESVKKTSRTDHIGEYLEGVALMRFSEYFDIFSSSFPKIRVVLFEELAADPRGMAAAFLSSLDVPFEGLKLEASAPSNVSLHPYLVEYKRIRNHEKFDRHQSAALVKRLTEVQSEGNLACLGDQVSLLSHTQRKELLSLKAPQIEEIGTYVGRPGKDVFPKFERSHTPKQKMTLEIFEEIHAAVAG
ncbi:hypothetical protein [Shimia thalassica]|uniref:hypothetical protein n=1 Tax=Shimia thalassica TaxID=1715693 RepID=UPI0026E44049|nr:hypothetical protein [Shimia thalassica]MDO6799743.1 hypothetical protein [Shimia thalassica]